MSFFTILGEFLKHLSIRIFCFFSCFQKSKTHSMIVPSKDEYILPKQQEEILTRTTSSISASEGISYFYPKETPKKSDESLVNIIDLEVGLNTTSNEIPTQSDLELDLSSRKEVVIGNDVPVRIIKTDDSKREALPPPPEKDITSPHIPSLPVQKSIISIPPSPRNEIESFSSPISSRKRPLIVSPNSDTKKTCLIESPSSKNQTTAEDPLLNTNSLPSVNSEIDLTSTLPLLSSLPTNLSLSSSLPARLPSSTSSLLSTSSKVVSISEQEKLMSGAPEGEIYDVEVVDDNLLVKFDSDEEAMLKLEEGLELFHTNNIVWATQCEIITIIRRFFLFHFDTLYLNRDTQDKVDLLTKIIIITNSSLTNIRSLNVRNSIFLSTSLLSKVYTNDISSLSFFYFITESSQLFSSLIMKLANGPKFLVEKSLFGCMLTIKTLTNFINEVYLKELKESSSNELSLNILEQSLHWVILTLSSTITNKNSEVSSKSIELLCEFLNTLPIDLFKQYLYNTLDLSTYDEDNEDEEEIKVVTTQDDPLDLSEEFLSGSPKPDKLNDDKKKQINDFFSLKRFVYNDKENIFPLNCGEKRENNSTILFSKLFYFFYLGFTSKKGIIKEKLKFSINKLNSKISNKFFSFNHFFSFFLNDNFSLICLKEIEKSSTSSSLSSSSFQSLNSSKSKSFLNSFKK